MVMRKAKKEDVVQYKEKILQMKLDKYSCFSTVATSNANIGEFYDNRDEWLTTEEAAGYLRISVGALRNMTSNGQVPYYKLAGRNRYKRDELRNLMKKRGFYGN